MHADERMAACSSDGEVEQSESLPRSAFRERDLVDIRKPRRSALSAGMKRTLSRTITGTILKPWDDLEVLKP